MHLFLKNLFFRKFSFLSFIISIFSENYRLFFTKVSHYFFAKFSHYFFRVIFAYFFSRNIRIIFSRIFCIFSRNFPIFYFAKISHFFTKQIEAKFHEKSKNFRIFRERRHPWSEIFAKRFFLFAGNPTCRSYTTGKTSIERIEPLSFNFQVPKPYWILRSSIQD